MLGVIGTSKKEDEKRVSNTSGSSNTSSKRYS